MNIPEHSERTQAASSAPENAPLPSGATPRRIAVFAVKFLITLGLIYLIAARMDVQQFISVMAGSDPAYFAIAALVLGIQIGVHNGLWAAVLAGTGIHMPARARARILLFSLFLNQGLPAALGGVGGRIYLTWRAGAPFTQSMAAALAERLIFLIALLVICVAALPGMRQLADSGKIDAYSLFLASGIVGIIVLPALLGWSGRRLLIAPIKAKLRAALDALLRIRDVPGCAVRAVVMILLYHGFSVTALWLLTASVGSPMPPLLAMTLMPHVLLLAALPLSINGWGVREVAMAAILGLAGIPVEQAVAVSVLFGIAILATRLPLGLIWFWRPASL